MSVRVLVLWKRGFKMSIVRMWLGWPSARFVSVRYWDRFSASPRDPTSCYYDITRRLSTFPNVHFAASPVKSSTLSNNLLLQHTHNYTITPARRSVRHCGIVLHHAFLLSIQRLACSYRIGHATYLHTTKRSTRPHTHSTT